STKIVRHDETVVVDGRSVTIANLPDAGPSELHVLERALLTDLMLHDEDLTFDPPDPAPGVQTTAHIDVHNGGRLPATSFAVALYAGAPERGGSLLGFAFIDTLEGGAHRVVSVPFVNPGN